MQKIGLQGLYVTGILCLFGAANASAHVVAVDPGEYDGQWRADGGSFVTGPQSVDLATGSHTIQVGSVGFFTIEVDAGGVVVVPNNSAVGGPNQLTFNTIDVVVDPAAFDGQWTISRGEPANFASGVRTATVVVDTAAQVAVGSAGGFTFSANTAGDVATSAVSAIGGLGTLTFNTVDVVVDPGSYAGLWNMSRGEPANFAAGVRTATVVPGVGSRIAVGTFGAVDFTADGGGVVTPANPVSAIGGLNAINLNTVTVVIDPAAFDGQWSISRGPVSSVTGAQTVSLVPGTLFQVIAGTFGGFFVDIDETGNVNVLNGVSAVGGTGTLTFNTVDILVDPGDFLGLWSISRGEPGTPIGGVQTATLVPGTPFQFIAGTFGGFFVMADAEGEVEVSNGVSATGGSGTLTFNTTVITIDPGDFTGNWSISRAGFFTGTQNVALVPLVSFRLESGGAGEFFTVGEPCEVNPSLITLGAGTFTLDCGCVDTDVDGVCDFEDICPNDPENDADGDGVCGDLDVCSGDDATGDTDGDGICDDIDFCTGANASGDADGDGICNDLDQCTGTDATGDSDADGICDSDDLCLGDDAVGDADGDLVCDDLDVCEGNDSSGDTDGDDVCDDSDVCPLDPLNDEDGDGVCGDLDSCLGDDATGDDDNDNICNDQDLCEGNDATGDEDADGFCDDSDNCVTDFNPDQADADADGIGDVCEADTDEDGVPDDTDNCVFEPNGDQSDADGDGAGDPCDDDDDNDGVVDADDNCPLYANPDQADADNDGFGDVCDGDDDADGVNDDVDLCPGTPLGAVFDEDGCSGPQLIELRCGVPSDYGWHQGRYIRCVVRVSKIAQRRGLITRRQRARIIRRAVRAAWRVYRRRLRRWC